MFLVAELEELIADPDYFDAAIVRGKIQFDPETGLTGLMYSGW